MHTVEHTANWFWTAPFDGRAEPNLLNLLSAKRGGVGWTWHPFDCTGIRTVWAARRRSEERCRVHHTLPLGAWYTASAEKASAVVDVGAAIGVHPSQTVVDVFAAYRRQRADALARLDRLTDVCPDEVLSSTATDVDLPVPTPAELQLLDFQRAGVAYMMRRQNSLLADEPGLGKTIQVLGLCNVDPAIGKILVICPASIKGVWAAEARKWLIRPLKIEIADNAPSRESDFVIVNYDKIARSAPGQNGITDALLSRQWDLVVCDEAHYLKNPLARRTQRILGVAASDESGQIVTPGILHTGRRKVLLTGTPIVNRPRELWTLVHALDPESFPHKLAFFKRYCDDGTDAYNGLSNEAELQTLLRCTVMVRRLKKVVLRDMPAKVHEVVYLPQTPAIAAALEEERKALEEEQESQALAESETALAEWGRIAAQVVDAKEQLEQLEDDDSAEAGQYKRKIAQMQTIKIPFKAISKTRHRMAVAKAPGAVAFCEEMLKHEDKIVVFGHHSDVLAMLAARFRDVAVQIDGDTPIERRYDIVRQFQEDPKIKVFIGQMLAAGTGLTLTRARSVIFAELDWTPGNMEQAADRVHRIGQTRTVHVYYLTVDGSIDGRMAQVMVEKQAQQAGALNRDLGAVGQELGAPATPEDVPPFRVGQWVVPVAWQPGQMVTPVKITDTRKKQPGEQFHGVGTAGASGWVIEYHVPATGEFRWSAVEEFQPLPSADATPRAPSRAQTDLGTAVVGAVGRALAQRAGAAKTPYTDSQKSAALQTARMLADAGVRDEFVQAIALQAHVSDRQMDALTAILSQYAGPAGKTPAVDGETTKATPVRAPQAPRSTGGRRLPPGRQMGLQFNPRHGIDPVHAWCVRALHASGVGAHVHRERRTGRVLAVDGGGVRLLSCRMGIAAQLEGEIYAVRSADDVARLVAIAAT